MEIGGKQQENSHKWVSEITFNFGEAFAAQHLILQGARSVAHTRAGRPELRLKPSPLAGCSGVPGYKSSALPLLGLVHQLRGGS
ncbi:hypothetical protein NQZ68_026647 [Dissostichus eleginoides]|nr:hypothetical protein NQZ68_026647 [Dissostichus eleginoides]